MFAGNFGVIGAAAVAGLAVITPRRITARARENARRSVINARARDRDRGGAEERAAPNVRDVRESGDRRLSIRRSPELGGAIRGLSASENLKRRVTPHESLIVGE